MKLSAWEDLVASFIFLLCALLGAGCWFGELNALLHDYRVPETPEHKTVDVSAMPM